MEGIQSKFVTTARHVLELLCGTINARSFFVASTKNERFIILDVINKKDGCTIPREVDEPLEESYCNHVVSNQEPLLIKDTITSQIAKDLNVTNAFSIGSYLGVPIILEDGSIFGTLCALDPEPNKLSSEDIPTLNRYANFIANTIELEDAFKKLNNYESQTKRELALASSIQTNTLKLGGHPELEADYIYKPSSILSGDLYAWYLIENDVYGVIILDIMGHGVSAALIGMAIYPQLKDFITTEKTPYKVMSKINTFLAELFSSDDLAMFVTGIYICIDNKKKHISYLNAGHPPGVLLIKETRHYLDQGTIPLGLNKTLPNITDSIPWHFGSSLIIYTDGLLDHCKIGKESPVETLNKLLDEANLRGESFCSYIDTLLYQIEDVEDDICVLSFHINK